MLPWSLFRTLLRWCSLGQAEPLPAHHLPSTHFFRRGSLAFMLFAFSVDATAACPLLLSAVSLPLHSYIRTGCPLSCAGHFTVLQSRHFTLFTEGGRELKNGHNRESKIPKCTQTTLVSLPPASSLRTVSLGTGTTMWGLDGDEANLHLWHTSEGQALPCDQSWHAQNVTPSTPQPCQLGTVCPDSQVAWATSI